MTHADILQMNNLSSTRIYWTGPGYTHDRCLTVQNWGTTPSVRASSFFLRGCYSQLKLIKNWYITQKKTIFFFFINSRNSVLQKSFSFMLTLCVMLWLDIETKASAMDNTKKYWPVAQCPDPSIVCVYSKQIPFFFFQPNKLIISQYKKKESCRKIQQYATKCIHSRCLL